MNVFNIITLLGGLAMFLYGMRLMGNSLREGASGTLKAVLGKLTDSSFKAFLTGLAMTAVIQSSTATIVITSGLVGAGLLTLHQSLGIIIGANVGTTVTGQIIRLLDIDSSGNSWLQIFKPSTLAPVALIIGIVLIMRSDNKKTGTTGNILIGFGILFSGLLNMTGAVSSLSGSAFFGRMLSALSRSPFIGYAVGAAVAFMLQSSSATIGILQAFSVSGGLTFGSIYAVIVGIYLGDCVTTAIVCSIGAKPEARRVGIVNILFNLSETVLVLTAVIIARRAGWLDAIWNVPINSGGIANTNTIFNLSCALLLLPVVPVYEKMSRKIVRDEPEKPMIYNELLEALNPKFFDTPALAFGSCYDAMKKMLELGTGNLTKAVCLIDSYDEKVFDEIYADEEIIDAFTDRVSHYLVELSPHTASRPFSGIFEEYTQVLSEFERIGDHAMNIAERAKIMKERGTTFSSLAICQLGVLMELAQQTISCAREAFEQKNLDKAKEIEPLEEVMDDMVDVMKEGHMERLRKGQCEVYAGAYFLDILTDMERVSDCCSNIGLAVVARMEGRDLKPHDYIAYLHEGNDTWFNEEYSARHDEFFSKLQNAETESAGM